jgi:hypothetical protein
MNHWCPDKGLLQDLNEQFLLKGSDVMMGGRKIELI